MTRAFKATYVQALNIEAYLTYIGFKLDKKVDQTATCLCFRFIISPAYLKTVYTSKTNFSFL